MPDELTIDQLRAMAAQADNAQGNDHDADATPPEPAQPDGQKADKHDSAAPSQDAAQTEKPEQSPGPPKDRAVKSEERLEKTWQAVNAEKAAIAAERAELERLRAEARPQQSQREQPAGIRDNTGRTAQDYRTAAKQFAEEGEAELADLAEKRAESLAEQEAQAQESASIEATRNAWMESVTKTVAEKPDLADQSTELSRTVKALIDSNPVFVHMPNGFAQAVEVAEAKIAAGRVTSLESETKELRKQLDEARKKLSPNGGGASYSAPGNRSLDQLGAGQRKTALLQMAAALDNE